MDLTVLTASMLMNDEFHLKKTPGGKEPIAEPYALYKQNAT